MEEKLYQLSNKLHSVIDSVTSSMHEMGMEEDSHYLELISVLAESEELLIKYENKEK